MADILAFPSLWERRVAKSIGDCQLDLFLDVAPPLHTAQEKNCHFIDFDHLDQFKLLGAASDLSLHALVDLRPLPVFERPNFIHDDLFREFSKLDVFYSPVVYSSFVDASFKTRRKHLNRLRDKAKTGSIGVLFSQRNTERDLILFWSERISKLVFQNVYYSPPMGG